MKKRIIFFSLLLVVGIVFFIGMITQTGINEIWLHLKQFKLLHFGVFLGLSTLNFMLYTLRWHLILNRINEHKIGFFRLFMHRMSGFAVSYITPTAQTGGEPLRILLLHEDGVSSRNAASSVIIDKGLEFAALFIFIGAGMGLALLEGSLDRNIQYLFLGLLAVLVSLISWFYYSSVKNMGVFSSILRFFRLTKFKHVKSLEEKIIEIEDEMAHFYKKHMPTFLALVIISLVIASFLLLEHWLIARFMGVNMTFLQTFLVSTIPYIAFMIPIPGGLGVLEGGHAAIFAALGISINAFVLVFIIRIRDLVFVLIGLIHASKQAFQMLKKAFIERNNV